MGNFSPRRSSTTDMLSRSTRLVSSPIRTAAVVRPGSGLVAADVKQLDEDTRAQSYRYVRTGTDHYSLAFTYDCVAWSRDTGVPRIAVGVGRRSETDIRTMRF